MGGHREGCSKVIELCALESFYVNYTMSYVYMFNLLHMRQWNAARPSFFCPARDGASWTVYYIVVNSINICRRVSDVFKIVLP